jgi:hypothetical protein
MVSLYMDPHKANEMHRFSSIAVFITYILLFYGSPSFAQMQEVSESDLSQISAQAGISYNWGNSQLDFTMNSIRYSDTDSNPHNWLELNDLSISGPGGYFTLDGRHDNEADPYTFNTIDVATTNTSDNQVKTLVQFVDSTNTNQRIWTIGHLVFCSQDLGSIQFDAMNVDPSIFNVTTHGAGMSGIEFEYLSNWKVQNFTYTYNSTPVSPDTGVLNIAGIHIAESSSGAPENPSSWVFSGRFRVGDIVGGNIDVDNNSGNAAVSNPATFDVGTTDDGITSVYMNIPMKGTIRAEEVNFGGTNFGPVAIDGITAHHIFVKLNPGN